MKKSKIAKVISIIFKLFLIIGVSSLLFLPYFYDLLKEISVKPFNEHILLYKLAFYLIYFLILGIIYELIIVFKSVYEGSPFNKEVEKSLKISAILFMVVFLIIIIKMIFIPNIISLAISFFCFMISLSFYVLAEVIKAAIEYKNELDYTV